MDDDKKYYWLRLKKDFFKRHDIRIIEDMPNGKDYVLFYLKLLCESVDHEGSLRFSEQIPYNEQMLSTITNTNVDIVRCAIKVFTELQLMEILDDKTIYMSEVNKMMGFETKWAEKKREYRERLKGQCPTDVLPMSDKSKSIELEIEKEIDIEEKEIFKEKEQIETLKDLIDAVNLNIYDKQISNTDIEILKNIVDKGYSYESIYRDLENYKNKGIKQPIAYYDKAFKNATIQEKVYQPPQEEEESTGSAWLDNFNKKWRK